MSCQMFISNNIVWSILWEIIDTNNEKLKNI